MPRPALPYPASPRDVPEDLTKATSKFMWQAGLLLVSLFVFVMVYIGLIVLSIYLFKVGLSSFSSGRRFNFFALIGFVFSIFLFIFLVKGIFASHAPDKTLNVEIKEDDHPTLFEFLYRLCDEVGATYPDKVFVSPEVNAAVMYDLSFWNLFVPPRKNLLIGLGLVNGLNLSEFKAVMAHELGHVRQKSFIIAYTYVATRIISEMVLGHDWFDRGIDKMRNNENMAWLGWPLYSVFWLIRKVLFGLLYAITFLQFAISREREYNADLVAASVSGSDAIVHGLLRTEFAHVSLMQAFHDLEQATDHRIYSADLFYHQTNAAPYVREIKKDDFFGEPPRLKFPRDGESLQVFDLEEENEDDIPPMWRRHPTNHDREANAKAWFVEAEMDERSPWMLFDKMVELRERVSYKFYRLLYKVPKDVELADAEWVQKFIDDEHAELRYDEKYRGAYDERPINPGDLGELKEVVNEEEWEPDRIASVHKKLYRDLGDRIDTYNRNRREFNRVLRDCRGRPTRRLKRLLDDLDHDLQKDYDWLNSFDRRVFLVHAHMARQAANRLFREMVERYQFQMQLQSIHKNVAKAQDSVGGMLNELENFAGQNLPQGFFAELMHTFREARAALRDSLRRAKEMNLPAMANMNEGERLDLFILDGELLGELPETMVRGKWIDKLLRQMAEMRSKANRLHFKSLGGILSLQERIAEEWHRQRNAIPQAIIEAEPEKEIPEAIVEEE